MGGVLWSYQHGTVLRGGHIPAALMCFGCGLEKGTARVKVPQIQQDQVLKFWSKSCLDLLYHRPFLQKSSVKLSLHRWLSYH